MPYADPEKRKQYRQDNKEYQKEYRKKNKEIIKEQQKEYNKEYRKNTKEKSKEYRKTPKGKKSNTISNWKRIGLIHDNYEELYNKYLNTTECEVCKYVFDKTNWRCMDHCHTTGLFRQILCNNCNMFDRWEKLIYANVD